MIHWGARAAMRLKECLSAQNMSLAFLEREENDRSVRFELLHGTGHV